MLDPRRLVTLQAVLRTGSFAAAAGELGYTQAAVSQHIAELEGSAGLKLLERRPVRPTEAGLIALRAADASREAIAAAATELRALRDGHAGTLRLGRSRRPPRRSPRRRSPTSSRRIRRSTRRSSRSRRRRRIRR